MWHPFRRKSRNRRLGGGTVLDVKLRSDQVRSQRARVAAIGLGVTFATVFCVYLLWRTGEWAMNRLVYENDAFAIQTVAVETDGVLAPDQIRRWAAVKPGANLMALDLHRVRRDLELVPAIAAVAVERVLPHTLSIRVTERVPVAQVHLTRVRAVGGVETVTLLLDADGWVMPPLDPRERAVPVAPGEENLPVIVGVGAAEVQIGRRIEAPRMRAALEMLAAFHESPLAAVLDLRRVDVSAPGVLVVTTDRGATVTLGTQDFERQFLRWRDIHERGLRHGRLVASLDLAVTNNIPARWMEASLDPNPAPRPPARPPRKPAPTRRNA